MGTINITIEPIELVIDGTTVYMQADPTAGPAWGHLLEAEWSFKDAEAISKSITDLTAALTDLAHTTEDADTLRGLGLGLPTLKAVVQGYVAEVVGFPTQPPSTSTGRSKKTGGT